MNEVMKTILHRRAVRRFQQRQVAEDALEQILEAGLYAPSPAAGRACSLPSARTVRSMKDWGKSSGPTRISVWPREEIVFPENSPALPTIPN